MWVLAAIGELGMNAQLILRSEILDDVTCDVCMDELNGITLPADDPAWAGELGEEAHDNCRVMFVPLFEGIDPVMDVTPASQIPEIVHHMQQLLPAGEAARRLSQLQLLNGEEILRARGLTLDDLSEIYSNEELLLHIFGITLEE